ncbi:MAG: septum formation inhibitor Maf [Clostridia bacterium]|nr:septum formation inhibitor Maf [Clostridia bacterium]
MSKDIQAKIILASSSPRRRELLSKAEVKFDICIKSVDETVPEGMSPAEGAEHTAAVKAMAVAFMNTEAVVIGADTIVVLGDEILGKPKDKADAADMLKKLSGQEHEVITGVCLAYKGKYETFHCSSKVKFYELTDDEIRHYVASGEPMDKAGAYGIQGKGMMLVESINGDYCNIVGLPVALTVRRIKELLARQ